MRTTVLMTILLAIAVPAGAQTLVFQQTRSIERKVERNITTKNVSTAPPNVEEVVPWLPADSGYTVTVERSRSIKRVRTAVARGHQGSRLRGSRIFSGGRVRQRIADRQGARQGRRAARASCSG